MATVQEDLNNLKNKLKEYKTQYGSTAKSVIKVLETEIEIYEDALRVKNPESEIKAVQSEIVERNYKISELEALNDEDRKYINILRRRLLERQNKTKEKTTSEVQQTEINYCDKIVVD